MNTPRFLTKLERRIRNDWIMHVMNSAKVGNFLPAIGLAAHISDGCIFGCCQPKPRCSWAELAHLKPELIEQPCRHQSSVAPCGVRWRRFTTQESWYASIGYRV
jgi:hypothetical protein